MLNRKGRKNLCVLCGLFAVFAEDIKNGYLNLQEGRG